MEATGFTAATGRTEYLELFVAQLQNQDPLQPVEQQDMLSQLAQFSTVEGIETLNDSQAEFNANFAQLLQLQLLNNGTELLGKEVTFGAEGTSGIATEIQQDSGQVLVRVGEFLVPVSDIATVAEAPNTPVGE